MNTIPANQVKKNKISHTKPSPNVPSAASSRSVTLLTMKLVIKLIHSGSQRAMQSQRDELNLTLLLYSICHHHFKSFHGS